MPPTTGHKQSNTDSLANALVGLGHQADKTMHTRPMANITLSDAELSDIWDGEGFAKKVCTAKVEDAVRNWFTIEGDTENKIVKYLDSIGMRTALFNAGSWARLYGGSLIVGGYGDGQDLERPLVKRKDKPVKLMWVKVYPRPRIPLTTLNLNQDMRSLRYEEPEYYPILPYGGMNINVHWSRAVPMKGEIASVGRATSDFRTRYWGTSILQAMWSRIAGLGGAIQGTENLTLDYSIGVFKLKGLAALVSGDQNQRIHARMDIINMSKSLLRSVLLDSEEEFRRDTANMSGLPDVLDRLMMMNSAVTEYPMTRLFGRSPAGLNATGESDLRLYYDQVESYQELTLTPTLMPFILHVNRQLGMVVPEEELTVKWESPWSPTQKEELETQKIQMEIDTGYIQTQVVDSDEVRASRYAGDTYSYDTVLNDTGVSDPVEPDPDDDLMSGAE